MQNLHIPFLSHYFQNISLFRQSEKKKPHIVRQHDMGRYACPCERGFSAVINLFHPYCTMFGFILQERGDCYETSHGLRLYHQAGRQTPPPLRRPHHRRMVGRRKTALPVSRLFPDPERGVILPGRLQPTALRHRGPENHLCRPLPEMGRMEIYPGP